MKESLYGDSAINCGRQKELDLAKCGAILCLALIHCVIECTPEEQLVSGIPYLFDTVIGGPLSATVFMFAMGVGVAHKNSQSTRDGALRGLRIMLISYMLNICRFLIPYLIGYGITGDTGKYIDPLLYKVLCNDVLLFAGMALVLIALFRKMKLKDWQMAAIAFAASAAGTMLNGVDVNNALGNILLGYLIGTEDAAGMVMSYFPLLNWLVFPVSGYIFGKRLLRLKDKNLFYGILSAICVPVATIYYAVGIVYERGMFGEGQNCYYHLQFSDALGALLSTIGVLGICHFLIRYLPEWVSSLSQKISRNITSIYCIHWVLVVYITNLGLYIWRGTQVLPVWQTLLLGAAIEIAAIYIAAIWQQIRKRVRGWQNEKKA